MGVQTLARLTANCQALSATPERSHEFEHVQNIDAN